MSENLPPLGFYGVRSLLGGFGRPNAESTPHVEKLQPEFGKRASPSQEDFSLQHIRLSHLLCELSALFDDEADAGAGPSFMLTDGDKPQLFIGETAVVLIDDENGLLVFSEVTPDAGLVIVTASVERLVDHIIGHLAANPASAGPATRNQAARMMVGQTLADVERRVILQTLRHCHGNRTRAAQMLGVSLHAIRSKLRSYWMGHESGGGAR